MPCFTVSFNLRSQEAFPSTGLGAIRMNWDQIQGKWKHYRGQAKVKWGKLTDDDLTAVSGNRDQLVGKVQEYYGLTKKTLRLGWTNLSKACPRKPSRPAALATAKSKAGPYRPAACGLF